MNLAGATIHTRQGSIPQDVLSNAGVRHICGFGPWKDFVHDHFPWLEQRQHHARSNFKATVDARSIGDGTLTTISVGASEVRRTRQLADGSESGLIKLLWQFSGQLALEQDGRQCLIDAGRATVCDTTRPYQIRLSEGARFAVLMFPHEGCPGWDLISQNVCGSELRDASAVRAALGALMAMARAPGGSGESDQTVWQAVQWMLSMMLHRSASSSEGMSHVEDSRLKKAQHYIMNHISDPRLNADDVASALCMSRRSFYTLLKEQHDSTPAKLIRAIRLERCLQMLSDRRHQSRKIIDIALDLGFHDYATFSRQFKAQYGLTPSEYRLRAKSSVQGVRT